MRDRVRRPKEKEYLFNKLKESSKYVDGFFSTYKDILIFAAALGFKYTKRIPFNDSSEPISLSVFTKDNLYFIDILALGETKDINLLDWEDKNTVEKKLTIFEEYANGGLNIMDRKIFTESGTLYDNFIQLLYEELNDKKNKNELDELTKLIEIEDI